MNLPPAIVLGGETIAVSVARSLARSGVEVHALGHGTDPVRRSRHCSSFADVGAGNGVQQRYLQWLERGPREGAVLPCDDDGLEMVARNRALLEGWGYLPVEADDEALLAMLDKQRTYEIARRSGVPAPQTMVLRSPGEAYAVSREFEYPCALKPTRSHDFSHRFGILAKAIVVENGSELLAAFERTQAFGIDMIVTEIVPGGDDRLCSYYTYVDRHGDPLFHFTKRKLRQWPNGFGLGTYQATDWNPEAVQLGLRFVRGAGIRGVANVEFKRDPRDGRLKLIECNHRFTAAVEQVRRAGIDIPLLVYNTLVGRPRPPVDGYRTDVYLWHPLDDLRAFRAYRRRGELGLGAWVRSLMRAPHTPMLSLDDPGPTLASLATRGERFTRGRLRLTALTDVSRNGSNGAPRPEQPPPPTFQPAAERRPRVAGRS
jgi:predicted ATP-grasp superfamily ATP-dependent carboligase